MEKFHSDKTVFDVNDVDAIRINFLHPDEVLRHSWLSVADKRAILASWASDQHAVADLPTLRQLESGVIVTLDSVMAALKSLDGAHDTKSQNREVEGRRSGLILRFKRALHARRSRKDDDDDPPPCPAAAANPALLFGDASMRHAA